MGDFKTKAKKKQIQIIERKRDKGEEGKWPKRETSLKKGQGGERKR